MPDWISYIFENYYALTVIFFLMIISEFFIWLFTDPMTKKKQMIKSDRGSYWLLTGCFSFCIIFAFLSVCSFMPEFIRLWQFPSFFYYLGILFIIAGVVIRIISAFTLKSCFSFVVQTSDDQILIRRGLYKFIRNPAYAGSLAIVLGNAFSMRSIFASIIAFVLCFWCYSVRIYIEEAALQLQFGEEFHKYRMNSWRMFPFIW